MGGLFGGLLGIVNVIGGSILTLLIGSKAWTESEDGRFFRLGVGVLFIGPMIGVASYLFVFRYSPSFSGVADGLLFCCFIATVVFGGLTLALEWIRQQLE
jgi:hypothetical protein